MAMIFGLTAVVTLSGQSQPAKPPTSTASQPAVSSNIRIAFINLGALLKGMPGYAQAESTFKKESDGATVEAQKLQAVFDSAVSTYRQSQAMMNPSQRTQREKLLGAQQDTLQGKLQALQQKLAGRQRELLAPMQDRLQSIIDGVRAEGNYALIIDLASDASTNIVSYDKSLDITLRVAQRLAQPSN
jgi:Skp family chaperone for outer membrane proteins